MGFHHVVAAVAAAVLLNAGEAGASAFSGTPSATSVVDAWDTSGEGVVSADEASTGLTAFVGGPGGECSDGAELVEAVDADGDGGIDVGGDEARAAAAALLLCLQSRSHGAVCIGEAVIEVGGEEFSCVPPVDETPVEDDHGHDDHGHGDGDAHGAEESSDAHDEDHTDNSDETDADAPQMRTGLGEAEEWTCSAVHHDSVNDGEAEEEVASSLSIEESWGWAMLATTVTSASSLVGIFFLRSGVSKQTADHMAAVAVGALLAAAFLHMLPEAIAYDAEGILSWRVSIALLAGVLTGFFCEHSVTAFRARKLDLAASTGQFATTGLGRHGHGHSHGAAHSHGHSHGHSHDHSDDAVPGVAEGTVANGDVEERVDEGASSRNPGEDGGDSVAVDTAVASREHEEGASAGEAAEGEASGVTEQPVGDETEALTPVAADGKEEVADLTAIAVSADAEDAGATGGKGVGESSVSQLKAASVLNSVVLVVLLGDGFHNLVDGIVLGSAFQACSVSTGWSVALAIILHEVPQEVSDFLILRRAGLTVSQALFWNFVSACTSFLGAITTLLVGNVSSEVHSILLAFSCGILIFLAATGIMPELVECHTASWSHILLPVVLIVVGMVVVGLTTLHDVHCEADGQGSHDGHGH